MTIEDERARIEADARKAADVENRLKNLETEAAEMRNTFRSTLAWVGRTLWAGAAYLAIQAWTYLSSGWTPR